MASTPAIAARPNVTSHGPSVGTALRVAGNVSEKHATPKKPRASARPEEGCAVFASLITLSTVLTSNNNAVDTLERLIRSRVAELTAGARMPSVRELQRTLHASPVTVQRAMQRLAAEGLVSLRPGSGTFVSVPPHLPPSSLGDMAWQTPVLGRAPEIPTGLDHLTMAATGVAIVLDNGFPDSTLHPVGLLGAAAGRAARRSAAWVRVAPEGITELRALFAAELGPSWSERNVVVTPGAQAGLDSVFRALVPHGSAVILEEPCYPGAIAAAMLSGLRCVPVPTDAYGLRTDLLERIIAESGARLMVVQPRHANPTGTVLSHERRLELLDIAHRRGVFIVEDDWVRDLDLSATTPPPLATLDEHGHVVYLRSLSKIVAPGLRVAAMVARGPALARLRSARLITDFFVSPLLQLTALEALTSAGWSRHLATVRTTLRHRRDVTMDSLSSVRHLVSCDVPTGGVALWLTLAGHIDEATFISALATRGVRIGAGRSYHLSESPVGTARLAFAAAPEDDLRRAAAVICDVALELGG